MSYPVSPFRALSELLDKGRPAKPREVRNAPAKPTERKTFPNAIAERQALATFLAGARPARRKPR